MSILISASSNSVARGYAYYLEGNVVSSNQISEFEFEGIVQGSQSNPYAVLINVKHPRKSSCECPFANGHTICKHMVALFFSAFPEEVDEYVDDLQSQYEEDYEDEEDFDEEGSDVFVKPLFFDSALNDYIQNLTLQELREHLTTELNRNTEYTFSKYLKVSYQKYIQSSSYEVAFVEKIHKRFMQSMIIYDFDDYDSSQTLLSVEDKKNIECIFEKNSAYKDTLQRVLLDVRIAIYDDYQWLVQFFKDRLTHIEKSALSEKLEDYLKIIKSYLVRSTLPKSNLLIALFILNDYSSVEIAQSLVRNGKYDEYVEYVIEHVKNIDQLYTDMKHTLSTRMHISESYIPSIFLRIAKRLPNHEEVFKEYLYLDILYNTNLDALRILREKTDFDVYYGRILKNVKKTYQLEAIFRYMNDCKALYELLSKSENAHRLIANTDVLKDHYHDLLLDYFKKQFYACLVNPGNRKTYAEAAQFVEGIFKLNDGPKLVKILIEELSSSDYSRRTALFDEIYETLDRLESRKYDKTVHDGF